jgi:Fic family protein
LIDESIVRARFWSDHRNIELNQRQRKALNKLLEAGPGRFAGGLTLRKYASMTSSSRATAWRDINELITAKILVSAGAGRGTYYNLAIPGWAWQPKESSKQ